MSKGWLKEGKLMQIAEKDTREQAGIEIKEWLTTRDVCYSAIPILPGTRLDVYDPRVDAYMPAITVRRYGYISEFILEYFGEEASRYPDCIDVFFDHRPGVLSKGHFTPVGSSLTFLNRGLV